MRRLQGRGLNRNTATPKALAALQMLRSNFGILSILLLFVRPVRVKEAGVGKGMVIGREMHVV